MNVGSSGKLQSPMALAMDGHHFSNSRPVAVNHPKPAIVPERGPMADAEQVVQRIKNNIAKDKEDAKEIQQVSEIVLGRKVQFNVNAELGQVVVAIVDPQTKRVIKEIPSADEQRIKAKMRRSTGHLFDALV